MFYIRNIFSIFVMNHFTHDAYIIFQLLRILPISLANTVKTRYNYLAEDVASSRKAEVKFETN